MRFIKNSTETWLLESPVIRWSFFVLKFEFYWVLFLLIMKNYFSGTQKSSVSQKDRSEVDSFEHEFKDITNNLKSPGQFHSEN